MAKKVNIDLDLRRSERHEVQTNLQIGSDVIVLNKESDPLFANCFDFSSNGMRIIIKTENRDLFKKEDHLKLSFIMPVSRELFEVDARVIWMQMTRFDKASALVIGVDFESLSAHARSVLDNYIEISKMSNQLGTFLASTPNLKDRLKDGSTWFAIIAVGIVAIFAFYLGQSLNDFQGVGLQRVPASSNFSETK
jgi:hypothetical protein